MVQETNYWKNRAENDTKNDWGDNETQDWIEDYWKSQDHPHRKVIVNALESFVPIESVLEVGCNCGPNLALIKDRFHCPIYGIDINEESIRSAVRHFPFAEFRVADATKIPFVDKFADVVIADAVLMYIPPKLIRAAISEMIRVAKKGIVIIDWYYGGSKYGKLFDNHWARNYVALFKEFNLKAYRRKLSVKEWPRPIWQKWGYIIKVHL